MNKQNVKSWTLRMPETLLDFLRVRAAQRTILENRNVSLNEVAVEALAKAAREKDAKTNGG